MNDVTDAAPSPPSPPADPAAVLRRRRYVALFATTTSDRLLGILMAALASLGLGVVLGLEAPLIALGGGSRCSSSPS
jgi:hypothetical protein